MSKFWKIFISIILALVLIVGVSVGIVTNGFKKWDKLSSCFSSEDEFDIEFKYSGYSVAFGNSYNGFERSCSKEDCRRFTSFGLKSQMDAVDVGLISYVRYFSLYHILKDDLYITAFSFEDDNKSISSSHFDKKTITLDIDDNLESFKEIINEGTDDSVIFKVWIEIKVLKSVAYNYDLEIIYHVFEQGL